MIEEIPPTLSTSTKSHKFFERYLDNDLEKLALELEDRYEKIQKAEVLGITELHSDEFFTESASVSTIKWRQYNVFQFHIEGIRNLFTEIRSMVKEACDYYEIDFDAQKFMVQGWFNVNSKDSGLLNWHEHGISGAPNFHGYYCVKAEPSSTTYKIFDKIVSNTNINNRAILSEMGHPHRQAEWDWKGSRITVAYDIVPFEDIANNTHKQEYEQHWIPLS